jgi:putative SOS response-associated peptidase YedK
MTRLAEIEQWLKDDNPESPEDILSRAMGGCQPFTVEAAQESMGIYLNVKLDSFMYEEAEAMEVAEMVLRVVSSWWRRREVMHKNPEVFGFRVQ